LAFKTWSQFEPVVLRLKPNAEYRYFHRKKGCHVLAALFRRMKGF
jgi:hypothetical protein